MQATRLGLPGFRQQPTPDYDGLTMEIYGKNGFHTLLKEGLVLDFGRGSGSGPNDPTVSRRHISFHLHPNDGPKARFEVVGKNPVWVYFNKTGEIRVYRRFEMGEMECGDSFCVSAKKPVWFSMGVIEFDGEGEKSEAKRKLRLEDELAERRGLRGIEELDLELGDVSNIDPVKEFGFVLMGHELDSCPKKNICDPKLWDWFLEEPGEEIKDDEEGTKKRKKKRMRSRRKKGKNADSEEDRTAESEEEADLITKLRKVERPKYATRSKYQDKSTDGTNSVKSIGLKHILSTKKPVNEEEEAEYDDDDVDKTLGGFIVDNENGAGEESDEDEEEEEEFEEDDDE